ncbi:MAG: DUF1080 domain-containing protein [Verrucomicrobiae bacterium]|nr:DUF1080 domain-containing protein [Verrucomicrobiae bacterium]
MERPPDRWSRLEIEARGDTLRFDLNGVTVNAARNVWPARGRIHLQCEGSEVFFRRLDLLPLLP